MNLKKSRFVLLTVLFLFVLTFSVELENLIFIKVDGYFHYEEYLRRFCLMPMWLIAILLLNEWHKSSMMSSFYVLLCGVLNVVLEHFSPSYLAFYEVSNPSEIQYNAAFLSGMLKGAIFLISCIAIVCSKKMVSFGLRAQSSSDLDIPD